MTDQQQRHSAQHAVNNTGNKALERMYQKADKFYRLQDRARFIPNATSNQKERKVYLP